MRWRSAPGSPRSEPPPPRLGTGNNVVTIDGVGVTGPLTARNNVVTVAGATLLSGDAHDNTS